VKSTLGQGFDSPHLHQFMNYIEERPWGNFENLLDCEYCKVKRIIVKPGQRLSYQYHKKRSEVWTVVKGEATVTINDKEHVIRPEQLIKIPVGTKHRVENKKSQDLIFIEVQTGTYFGEDDIIRLEDDYNRNDQN